MSKMSKRGAPRRALVNRLIVLNPAGMTTVMVYLVARPSASSCPSSLPVMTCLSCSLCFPFPSVALQKNITTDVPLVLPPDALGGGIFPSSLSRMPSVFLTRGLPSLGPPVSDWGTNQPGIGVTRNTRREKLGLWSAVALQEHFTATGGRRGVPLPLSSSASHTREGGGGAVGSSSSDVSTDLRLHLGPAQSLAGRSHKQTLAQRMGLVPGPPPAPSADDWRVVVHRALLREKEHFHDTGSFRGHSSVCAICQMCYSARGDEGQVILSCSHVFHTQCFRSFERYVRAQQRADALGVAVATAPLACPVCRTQNYHKRIFYEGKAVAQRAAIVKVQAAVRGLLARRAYTKLRLKNNREFRTHYVQERLARLSAAWEAFCAQQEQSRVAVEAALAVQHQAARAACLTEEAWAELWRKAVHDPSSSSESGSLTAPATAGVSVQCPICLELIYCSHWPGARTASFHAGGVRKLTGEDAVAAMRMAYEARQAAKRVQPLELKAIRKSTGMPMGGAVKGAVSRKVSNPSTAEPGATGLVRGGKVVSRRVTQHQAGHQKGSAQLAAAAPRPEHETAFTVLSSAKVVDADSANKAASILPQSGVLLSCGHYFHAACIKCYEQFNERGSLRVDEQPGQAVAIVLNRCPICRSGYAKHPM